MKNQFAFLLLALGPWLPAAALAADAADIVRKTCVACHGIDGNSSEPENPRIAGMDPEYLLRQLRAFASGQRRSEVMQGIVTGIEAEDLPRLAVYFAAQKPAPGKPRNTQLAAKGRQIYEDGNSDSGVPACAGCHQPDGAGNARFPRLAGQHQAYVLKQLGEYKSGRRASDRLMVTVGQRLTADEIKAVAEYIAGL